MLDHVSNSVCAFNPIAFLTRASRVRQLALALWLAAYARRYVSLMEHRCLNQNHFFFSSDHLPVTLFVKF
jgi:hypothetical protein